MNEQILKSSENPLGLKDSFLIYDFIPVSATAKMLDHWAVLVSLFCIRIKLTANLINFLSLISVSLGVLAIISLGDRGVVWGIGWYILSLLLNSTASHVARKTKAVSFFVLLWDRFFRNLATTVFRFGLLWIIYLKFSFNFLFWLGFVCLTLTPFYFFLHDRYSTFARWINEEKGKRINPSAGIEKFTKSMVAVEDVERVTLILALFWFTPAIGAYCLMNIVLQMNVIFEYFKLAYLNMRVSNYEISAARV